jgi:hypothetical protein
MSTFSALAQYVFIDLSMILRQYTHCMTAINAKLFIVLNLLVSL